MSTIVLHVSWPLVAQLAGLWIFATWVAGFVDGLGKRSGRALRHRKGSRR